jgi:hypothetical protein
MFKLVSWVLSCLRSLARDKSDLALENIALRYQLLLLQRQPKKAKSKPIDRLFRFIFLDIGLVGKRRDTSDDSALSLLLDR